MELWNRGQLKNIGKLQIIGHTPCESGNAEFNRISSTLNIDTGVYRPVGLTAVKEEPRWRNRRNHIRTNALD